MTGPLVIPWWTGGESDTVAYEPVSGDLCDRPYRQWDTISGGLMPFASVIIPDKQRRVIMRHCDLV